MLVSAPSVLVDHSLLKEDLARELEDTRREFLALLDQVPERVWGRIKVNKRWSAKECMWHILCYLSFVVPRGRSNALRGGKLRLPPGRLGRFLNFLIPRIAARKETKENLRWKYQEFHRLIMEMLQEIEDWEWSLETVIPKGRVSLEGLFRYHREHFQHHAVQIRRALATWP